MWSRFEAFDVMCSIKMFHFKLDWKVRPRTLWYSTRSSGVSSILRNGGGSYACEKFIISFLHLPGFNPHIVIRCPGVYFIKYCLAFSTVVVLNHFRKRYIIYVRPVWDFWRRDSEVVFHDYKKNWFELVALGTPAVMWSHCETVDPIFPACRRPVRKLEIQRIMDRLTFKLISFSITISWLILSNG